QQAWQDTRDGDTYLNKSDEAIDRDYQQALDAINEKKQACSDPLSEDHATWLQSASLARVFQTDYLTSRLDSGIEYVDHFIECIEEAADRAECAAVLQQWACAGDVTDPTNMLLRSLGHNQESHLAAIQDTPSLITLQNAASVLDGYRRAWEASREAVLQSHQAESAARNAFSRLMHQSGAPVARLLSKGLDQAVMHVYMAAAMFSTDRILIQRGVRGTPAQHIAMMAKQSRELIPANKRPSQRQMEKVIRQWLKKDGAALDIKVPHFFYLDREMLAAVANGHGGGGATTTRLLRTDGDILLTARNMRESVLPNFRRVIDSDVRMSSVGLFFTAISTYYAQNALEHARPFKSTEMRWRYYSCISSLVGGISELASKAFKGLERVGYLRTRPLVVIGLDVAGRLFGAAGAWIMAGLDGINASKEYKKGNWGLSFLYGLSSFFGILLGIALIMLSLSWVAILFVISLILSVLLSWFAAEYTQEWLSHSFYGTADRFESVKASKKELANVLG
ncbi:MAG: hypothetical protein HLX50_03620, partial [Alteromonadaceae bacterium]|nr:hypothetical protein [Alteromonadaceae bacterium]